MRILALLLLPAATGCASATLTAFRDPAFADRRFERIAVFAVGMYLDNAVAVENQVCANVAPSPCVSGKSVLPPTRAYSDGEIREYLANARVDGVLIVALTDDQTASQYLRSIVSGSASTVGTQSGRMSIYGNNAYWSGVAQTNTSARTVATPVYGYRRTAFAAVGLFDRQTGNIAWRGDMRVSGQGALNVTDGVFISAASKEIAYRLKSAQLIH